VATLAKKPKPDADARPRHPLVARISAVVVVLFLIWHFALTFAWNSQQTALTDLITPKALNAYMQPWFQQNWSVFAPDPVSANLSFDVRARVGGADEASATPWYTVTDADIRRGVLHKPIPNRDYLTTFALVDDFYGAFRALPDSAQGVVSQDRTGDSGWLPLVRDDLIDGGVPQPDADTFSRYEDSAYRLATAVAQARWGSGVTSVQVRLRQQQVQSFAARAQGPTKTYSYFTDGWRAPLEVGDVDLGVIKRLYGGGK
jgi:hypothetical protein